ncbi:ABC transporter, permease protein [Lapidilactobacillus concavus DSM 17758]|uniref:ABC transporter, permease protein n=1 Tax=Lapidilactobacillus concavus DSM 17758 TaxID=1423735 RepID=A0A0R1VUI2_9LACO|nr:amino acid ABC transporter permease [Lapidilactobacillus concavus]KRM09071.1 ABC transporter, permease protein [Lapidilactobacillus concavus DSM 17758]GEL13663.1 glutamine ABC transporter permease [Lapidilactobacillus concavus]
MQNFIDAYSWVNLRFLLEGLWVTIYVSAISVVLSFIIGSILGLIRYVKIKYLSMIVGFIIDLIRNLPLLLIIFFMYFGLPSTFGIRLNTVTAAIVALTVFESAMLAEIIRSGIQSIGVGQMEAARSNGLTYLQAMWYIILPQAFRNMVPPIVSQFVSLVKDSSLATIILLPELMYHSQIIYGQNTNYMIPMFVALAFLYFVICFLLSRLSKRLARRLH